MISKLARSWCAIAMGVAIPAQWAPIEPTLHGRADYAMAFDPARQRVVLFGGRDVESLGDTWEWDGSGWHVRIVQNGPGARYGHCMAFCSVRRSILLFGGRTAPNGQFLADTWEWDGQAWTQLKPTQQPSGRAFASCARDAVRGKIVLFGGKVASNAVSDTVVNDTWEWDGRNWNLRKPSRAPGARGGAAFAYDAKTRRCVLYGGTDRVRLRIGDTWLWDGTNWVISSSVIPGMRYHSNLASATVAGAPTMLVHTSKTVTVPWPSETWRWDGLRWVKSAGTLRDRIILQSKACTDGKGLIYFSERTDQSTSNAWSETWRYNGQAWRLAFRHQVAPRVNAAQWFAFDEARDSFLAVGLGGTWSLRGNEIKSQGSAGLTARGIHDVAFHRGSARAVLQAHYYSSDTWTWSGSKWAKQNSASRPPARTPKSNIVYDDRRDRLVLFSGSGFRDLWEWRPSGWRVVAKGGPPAFMTGAAAAYDVIRDRVMLCRGNDPWEFDGNVWRQIKPKAGPGARIPGSGVFVPELGGVVFGGGTYQGRANTEVWLWDGVSWRQLQGFSNRSSVGFPVVDFCYDTGRKELRAFRPTSPGSIYSWALGGLTVSQTYPKVGQSITLSFGLAKARHHHVIIGLAWNTHPGIPLRLRPTGGTELFPLKADQLLNASLSAALTVRLDTLGRGSYRIPIPNQPWFAGLQFHAAGFSVTPTPNLGAVTNAVAVEVVR